MKKPGYVFVECTLKLKAGMVGIAPRNNAKPGLSGGCPLSNNSGPAMDAAIVNDGILRKHRDDTIALG
jgi:hypothetical protein